MKEIISCIVGCVLLSACATPGVEKTQLDKIAVIQSVPAGARIIGPVEASHCKRNGYETNSAEMSALDLVRMKASEMGANAIADVKYETEGLSFLENCWSSAKAKATAIRR